MRATIARDVRDRALVSVDTVGEVRSSGVFVKAELPNIVAAAAAAAVSMPEDFRVSISDPAGKTAYPISSFSWLLVPDKIHDQAKKAVIIDFLKWMLTQGQNMTEALSYARLPKRSRHKGVEGDFEDPMNQSEFQRRCKLFGEYK